MKSKTKIKDKVTIINEVNLFIMFYELKLYFFSKNLIKL